MHILKKIVTYIGAYGLIAFITGFVLMAYELAASRVLAPSIGSSTYVWTSVIGVMIAALAVGYAVGGWLADKRVAKADIAWLLIMSSLAVVATCLLYADVLAFVAGLSGDPRWQGVLATMLLFMPASFLLGTISPYLARLRTHSLTTTGRSVAGLSALNSVGGIVGTFCAGFIFFSFIGSRETLVLLAAILLATSWLVEPRRYMRWRVLVSIAVTVAAVAFVASPPKPGIVAHIDTPTAHYTVRDTKYVDGREMRGLVTGPSGVQSGVMLQKPNELVFAYARLMADIVKAAPKKDRILILGGGAYTVPEYLARQYPQSTIDVVEIDPHLERIATQYFDYNALPNVRAFAQDARTYLAHTASTYDLVLVDVYNDTSVPFSLATREYAEALKRVVAKDGAVLANMIGSTTRHCAPLMASIDTSYRTVFDTAHMLQVYPGRRTTDMQNFIAVYSHGLLEWLPLHNTLKAHLPSGQTLTDNFAPVEYLRQQCDT